MALTGNITGKAGTVKTGNATLGSAVEYNVTDWSLDISGGTIDVTDSASADWREKVVGKRKSASGSFSAIMQYGETDLAINTSLEAHFLADDTSGDEVYYSGSICITSMGISVPIEGEDAVKKSYNFEFLGAVTKTDASAA